MRFVKTVDLWANEDLIKAGKMKLQSGQVVRCGCDKAGCYSVFDYATPTYIRAFHGKTLRHARAKYLSVKSSEKLVKLCQSGKITPKVLQAGLDHSLRRFLPIN